jgi:hypothetical protein
MFQNRWTLLSTWKGWFPLWNVMTIFQAMTMGAPRGGVIERLQSAGPCHLRGAGRGGALAGAALQVHRFSRVNGRWGSAEYRVAVSCSVARPTEQIVGFPNAHGASCSHGPAHSAWTIYVRPWSRSACVRTNSHRQAEGQPARQTRSRIDPNRSDSNRRIDGRRRDRGSRDA